MDAFEAKRTARQWIVKNSGWQGQNTYLRMSQLGRCPRQQYDLYTKGSYATDEMHEHCFSGHWIEKMVMTILACSGIADTTRLTDGAREIVAPFDDRLRGHVDGWCADDGRPIEVTSMGGAQFMEFMHERRLPVPKYWQVQAYLRYSDQPSALAVVVSRDSHRRFFLDVLRDDRFGEGLEALARTMLDAITRQVPPGCTCGTCVPGKERRFPVVTRGRIGPRIELPVMTIYGQHQSVAIVR